MMAPVNHRSPKLLPVTPWGMREKAFGDFDKNGDNGLGKDEFMRIARGPDPERAFQNLDKDGSGSISRGEWSTQHLMADRSKLNALQQVGLAIATPFLALADLVVRAVQYPRETFSRDFRI